MRTREEIEKDISSDYMNFGSVDSVTLAILLDIRDLLIELKEKKV